MGIARGSLPWWHCGTTKTCQKRPTHKQKRPKEGTHFHFRESYTRYIYDLLRNSAAVALQYDETCQKRPTHMERGLYKRPSTKYRKCINSLAYLRFKKCVERDLQKRQIIHIFWIVPQNIWEFVPQKIFKFVPQNVWKMCRKRLTKEIDYTYILVRASEYMGVRPSEDIQVRASECMENVSKETYKRDRLYIYSGSCLRIYGSSSLKICSSS